MWSRWGFILHIKSSDKDAWHHICTFASISPACFVWHGVLIMQKALKGDNRRRWTYPWHQGSVLCWAWNVDQWEEGKKKKKDASCSDTTIISRARWQIAATYDLLIFNCFSECFVHRLGRSQWCRPAAELSRAGPVLACLSPQVTTLALGWSQREGPEKHDNKQDPHFHTVVWQHRPHNDTARRALDGAVTNVAWMQRSAVSVHSAGWWWWSYGSWAT